MTLWAWTLAVYERPKVPQACLKLQDDHGLSTAFLLWAVWANDLDTQTLSKGAAIAKSWEAEVLIPVRHVRRWLKAPIAGIADLPRETLRQGVKSTELDAERLLMESLAALKSKGTTSSATLESLRAAVAAWGSQNADDALKVLADALD